MRLFPIVRALMAISATVAASQVLADDIVLTPPAGGGVVVTNSAGDVTQLRVDGSGTTVNGNLNLPATSFGAGGIFLGGNRFMHSFPFSNIFIGWSAGNVTSLTGLQNVGIGQSSLQFNSTGYLNTAVGDRALNKNSTGYLNTAIGGSALTSNTTGYENTAAGYAVLLFNTTGNNNTAAGVNALRSNTTGNNNTASGLHALQNNTTGSNNVAIGAGALLSSLTGDLNSALGQNALGQNTTGYENSVNGATALLFNTTGYGNTAMGFGALQGNTTGNNNIGIGSGAGSLLTTGSNNIAIGNPGVAAESSTIRIGSGHTRTFIKGIFGISTGAGLNVVVDSNGQLGTLPSSRRFKDNITDMDAASGALMQLRPVTFHYKSDHAPAGRKLQFGLVAEEVAEVFPELVAYSTDGQIESVMYQYLAPMLLNEYQKQQRKLEAQASLLSRQTERLAQLERDRQIQAAELADLKQGAARMARVLGRLEREGLINTARR